MLFLVCARCGQRFTVSLQLTKAASGQVPGEAALLSGTYKTASDGGFVLNSDDLKGLVPHPDTYRSGGCCGSDGTDGPNRVCARCGREVGTEESDCWKPHSFVTLPGAAKPITDRG